MRPAVGLVSPNCLALPCLMLRSRALSASRACRLAARRRAAVDPYSLFKQPTSFPPRVFAPGALHLDAVPTANEYSQLVTPQTIYFIHRLFKRRLSHDLNWFRP